MLAAIGDTLQALNYGLLAVGGGILLWHGAALFRSSLRTNPLRDAAWRRELDESPTRAAAGERATGPSRSRGEPRQRVSFLHVFAALFVFFAVLSGVSLVWLSGSEPQDLRPGTDAWFRGMAADHLARGAAIIFMAAVLGAGRREAAPGEPPRHALRGVWIGTAAAAALIPVIDLLVAAGVVVMNLVAPGEPPAQHVVLEALRSNSWGAAGVALLSAGAVVIAPVTEELFFRGLLLRALWESTRSTWLSAAISGLLFGLVHFSVPYAIVPLAFMGVALAYLRMRYDSLALCVVVHMLFNARTIIFALLAPELLHEGA